MEKKLKTVEKETLKTIVCRDEDKRSDDFYNGSIITKTNKQTSNQRDAHYVENNKPNNNNVNNNSVTNVNGINKYGVVTKRWKVQSGCDQAMSRRKQHKPRHLDAEEEGAETGQNKQQDQCLNKNLSTG